MRDITVTVPDEVQAEEAKLLLAMKLLEEERLSMGQAAALAGYSKRAFIEVLGKHGMAVIDHSVDDLDGDVRNA